MGLVVREVNTRRQIPIPESRTIFFTAMKAVIGNLIYLANRGVIDLTPLSVAPASFKYSFIPKASSVVRNNE